MRALSVVRILPGFGVDVLQLHRDTSIPDEQEQLAGSEDVILFLYLFLGLCIVHDGTEHIFDHSA